MYIHTYIIYIIYTSWKYKTKFILHWYMCQRQSVKDCWNFVRGGKYPKIVKATPPLNDVGVGTLPMKWFLCTKVHIIPYFSSSFLSTYLRQIHLGLTTLYSPQSLYDLLRHLTFSSYHYSPQSHLTNHLFIYFFLFFFIKYR